MFNAALVALLTQAPPTIALDTLDLSAMTTGYGEVHKDRSIDNHPLKIGGRSFDHGVGTHARSEYTVLLNGGATSFHCWVGIDDETTKLGEADFKISVDGHVKADSGILHGGDGPKEMTVDLKGAKWVTLVADEAGQGIDFAHADWADAQFGVTDSSVHLVARGKVEEPTMDISHVDLVKTELHGPLVIGCTPGHEFLYRIPVSGEGPIACNASGLPPSIKIDRQAGILRGTVPDAGKYLVRLTAYGPNGRSSRLLTIVAGDHVLAQTPPMGWNSWNVWANKVDASKVQAAADEFIQSHLADFGYQYVNIDDTWEGTRGADGIVTTNGKFGDMANLANYVHSKGLKLGIYSSPGPRTCAGFEGSYKHELDDATTYAKWGIDYLKYDWCSYGGVPHPDGLPGYQLPYEVMRKALDQAPRDIVYSLCQYGMGDVYKWGHTAVGGNLWRTTGDITDTWGSMSNIGFNQDIRSPYAGPGGWNDPDMLVVGRVGWGNTHPSRLTGNEQITHISLWCLLAAPLMIGCDLTQLDQLTRDVLMNPEILDIDQDPKGMAATRKFKDGDVEVWARDLYDGSWAIGLFNRGPEHQPVTTVFHRDIGPTDVKRVRDLWRRKDVSGRADAYSAEVPAHGAVVIRVWR